VGGSGKVLEKDMRGGRLESIPCVPVGQILGLLSALSDEPAGANIYDLSDELGREFGGTLALVQAAEMLGFVKTPKDEVVLTELGRALLDGGLESRRHLFGDQLRKLPLFRWALAEIKATGPIEVARLVHEIARAHPYEKAERVFETMVAWGRFGGILNLDPDGLYITQPRDFRGVPVGMDERSDDLE
jgi:NitT/TauT family transport system ATP-binding protein